MTARLRTLWDRRGLASSPFAFYPLSTIALAALLVHSIVRADPSIALLGLGLAMCYVAVHELGHIAAATGLGLKVLHLRVTPIYGRVRVSRAGSSNLQWALVVSAGPLAGAAFCALLLPLLPSMGLSFPALRPMVLLALIDNVLNLLPVHPAVDGYKAVVAVRRAMHLHAQRKALHRIVILHHQQRLASPAPDPAPQAGTVRPQPLVAPAEPPAAGASSKSFRDLMNQLLEESLHSTPTPAGAPSPGAHEPEKRLSRTGGRES